MASPVDASPWALTVVAKAARKVKGLCRDVLRRCRVADEERAEPETALATMQSTGVRNRRANDQAPVSTDDHEEISPESDQSPATSPTTTATSGTFTPGTSEGIPETSGIVDALERSSPTSANPGNAHFKIRSSR